jgi:hypothetical protein
MINWPCGFQACDKAAYNQWVHIIEQNTGRKRVKKERLYTAGGNAN